MNAASLLKRIDTKVGRTHDQMGRVQRRLDDLDLWKEEVDKRVKDISGRAVSLPGSRDGKDKIESFFSKMILGLATQRWKEIPDGKRVQDILEETRKRYIPPDGSAAQGRDLTTLVDSSSGALVPAEYIAELIPELVAKSVLMQAGARELTGLTGSPVEFPKKKSGVTPNDDAESDTITFTDQTFGRVSLVPKQLSAGTIMSRRTIALAVPGIDDIVRADLAEKLALRMDIRGLRGTGASNQPIGIVNFPDIGVVSLGVNGGELEYGDLIELEGKLEDANALDGRLGFIFHGKIRRRLAKQLDADGRPLFTRDLSGPQPTRTLIGYPFFVSQQLPFNLTKGTGTNLAEVIFGNFAELLIGKWGNLLIEVSTQAGTLFEKHQLAIKGVMEYDIDAMHEESFSVATDAKTQ